MGVVQNGSFISAYSGNEIDGLLSVVRGKNLLINSYFKGGGSQQGGGQLPINASSQTTLLGVGYICTGWYQRYGSPTTTLTANGIKSEGNSGGSAITQNFENGGAALSGQPLTLSALFQNTGLVWGSCAAFDPTKSLRIDGRNGGSFVYDSKSNGLPNQLADIRIPQNDYLIAAKLEPGDTQTLARQVNGTWELNDAPPNYQTELLKCQFYEQIIKNPDSVSPRYVATGMTTANSGTTVFPLKLSPMRLTSLSGDAVSISGSLYASNGSGTNVALNASNIIVTICPDSGIAELRVSGLTDFARGTPVVLYLDTSSYLRLDANIPNT